MIRKRGKDGHRYEDTPGVDDATSLTTLGASACWSATGSVLSAFLDLVVVGVLGSFAARGFLGFAGDEEATPEPSPPPVMANSFFFTEAQLDTALAEFLRPKAFARAA